MLLFLLEVHQLEISFLLIVIKHSLGIYTEFKLLGVGYTADLRIIWITITIGFVTRELTIRSRQACTGL